jgi:hypothetical protein
MDPNTEAFLRSVPAHRLGYAQEVINAANRYGVPAELALRTARQESGFNPRSTSSAGALGVMQLMPAPRGSSASTDQPGAEHRRRRSLLRDMLSQFGGDHRLALAAYNAGPNRVADWLKRGRPLPAETTNYVHAITDGGRWSPAAAPAPIVPRPVQTQPVAATEQPAGLLQIPGM